MRDIFRILVCVCVCVFSFALDLEHYTVEFQLKHGEGYSLKSYSYVDGT